MVQKIDKWLVGIVATVAMVFGAYIGVLLSQQNVADARNEGYATGYEDGNNEGYFEGYDLGLADGSAEAEDSYWEGWSAGWDDAYDTGWDEAVEFIYN